MSNTTRAIALVCLASLWAAPLSANPAATVKTRHAVEDGQGTLSQYGSGTVIARDSRGFDVLSCAHVVEHQGAYAKGSLTVTTPDGKPWPARVVRYDAKKDLSLMRVDAPAAKVEAVELAEAERYAPGLRVIKYGHPGGGRLVRAEGVAADYSTESNGYTNLIASARSASGDSGGGVYRAADRKLIGVIWGGREDGLRATRIADVRSFLREARAAAKR